MMLADITKHARLVARIKDKVARRRELKVRSKLVAAGITPGYSKWLRKYPELNEMLDAVDSIF